MRGHIKKIIQVLVQNDVSWGLIKPFAVFGSKIYNLRNKAASQILKPAPKITHPDILKSHTVLHGLFKGMIYPKIESVGSAIYPKLMGSYEKEIQSDISYLLEKNNYSEILDVGCAEGYYAIGLSLKCPKSKIYAYDTSFKARELCTEMAFLNGVQNNVIVNSTMTPKGLENFNFKGKGLIICDCEGYELQLFNKSNLSNLSNCDLIIETHDFKNIEISTSLKILFSSTHRVKSVYSIDDIHKALTYKYPDLKKYSLLEKKNLFREWRPAIMEWLICTPK